MKKKQKKQKITKKFSDSGRPEVAGAGRNLGGAGLNREFITMTVQCFKKLCLKSKTTKADEIHDYYMAWKK